MLTEAATWTLVLGALLAVLAFGAWLDGRIG